MRTITQHSHYNFVDKDPIFDRLKTIIDGHGLTLKQVADASGVTYQTLYGWFHGKTHNAYYSTVCRVVIDCASEFPDSLTKISVRQNQTSKTQSRCRLATPEDRTMAAERSNVRLSGRQDPTQGVADRVGRIGSSFCLPLSRLEDG
jgi:transcriptional regulator with XRE-family HTH domain